jgi:hypothetical protein
LAITLYGDNDDNDDDNDDDDNDYDYDIDDDDDDGLTPLSSDPLSPLQVCGFQCCNGTQGQHRTHKIR